MALTTQRKDPVLCHAVPGRVRLKSADIRHNERKASRVASFLEDREGILCVDVRPLTGSIVIVFDPRVADAASIVESAGEAISRVGQLGWLPDKKPAGRPAEVSAREGRRSVGLGLLKVVGFTGFMLFYLFRTWVLKSPLSPRILTAATIIGSLPLFRRALRDAVRGQLISVNLFLASGTVLALATKESAAALEVAWIREIGQLLEDYIRERSHRQIRETLLISAPTAFLVYDGKEIEVSVNKVREGNVLAVHALERIPVDGTVTEGEALVDESHITGRAEPEHRKPGEPVYAGAILTHGTIRVRASSVGEQTYLSGIVRQVEESLANRSQAEEQADVLAARLTAIGLVCTAAAALFTRDLAKTLAVQLAMTSPCATVLAASTAVTAALANAARHGVLIKGGLYLERFREIDCFCFDKTGTVTSESPTLTEIVPAKSDTDTVHVLKLAADGQAHNPHPIGKALTRAAADHGYLPRTADSAELRMGRGIRVTIGDETIASGNLKFMEEEGIDVNAVREAAADLENRGYTRVFVARNGTCIGLIGLAYPSKPELDEALNGLKAGGARETYLLSGDSEELVRRMGQKHRFDGYRGDMLPEDKAEYVSGLTARGRRTAMIGDGINDAPALARSGVGVAMGAGGARAAIEAADIALVDNRLDRLIYIRDLSDQTQRIINQNHWFAVITDVVGGVLGMLGYVSPVVSGLSHMMHSFVILANSGRLLGRHMTAATAPIPGAAQITRHRFERAGIEVKRS